MPTDLENAWDKGFESGYQSRDAEIERLKAGIAYVQMRLNDLPHINDENHICITCQAFDKCDELQRGE